MPYQFTTVVNSFAQAHAALANQDDDAAKNTHDRKVYAALAVPYAEVKKFYQEYEAFLTRAKTQCKSSMDGIAEKYNASKGKPDAAQLRLMKANLGIIQQSKAGLDRYGHTLQTDLMDWRGVWDTACAGVVFSTTALDAIKAYRKSVIDKQSSEWNGTTARISQYLTRAEALLVAAEKASKAEPTDDGSETLKQIKDAHTKAMSTGAKPVTTYMLNIENNYDKFKTDAKKGLDAKDKPNAAALWKSREKQFAQYLGYQKDLSGATKTLTILTKLINNGIGKVPKDHQPAWKAENVAIKSDLDKLATALKKYPDMLKSMETIKKHYQDAIHGK